MRKIIAGVLLVFAAFQTDAWARGGQVDPMLGTNGVVSVPSVDNYSSYEIAILPDGRLLVAHSVPGSVDLFMYRGDGTLDASFGRAGILNLPQVSAASLIAQPDGRVVLAGTGEAMSFVRLNPDGSFDPAFGTHGKATYPLADYGASVAKMRVLPDGSLMAASVSALWGYVSIVKLTPAGKLDASYGNAGLAERAFFFVPNAVGSAGDMRILDDGSVELVRGTSKSVDKSRLRADGSLDTSLGVAGLLSRDTILPANSFTAPLVSALLDDGSVLAYIVVATPFQTPSQPDFALKVSRYAADLSLDRGFGTDGIASFANFPGSFAGRMPDGGYLFAGPSAIGLQLLKLTARGAADTTFGANGVALVPLPVATDTSVTSLRRTIVKPDGYVTMLATNQTKVPFTTGPFRAFVAKAQGVGDIVEFRNAALDHYFLTYEGDEARGIDAGAAGPAWSRTGGSFRPGGTTPVCRFQGTPGVGPNSHFFTASADECESVKHAPGWTYEGLGFYTTPPVNGQCAAPLVPIHRLYNNRAARNDSNHRFVADTLLIAPMAAQGWVHEGIAFCAKP